jgi:hypothetical protein
MRRHDLREDYDDEPWRRRDPRAMVHWPALLMATFSMIQFGFSIVAGAWILGALVYSWVNPEFFEDEVVWYEMVLGSLVCAILAAMNWVILKGAFRFPRFRSYRLVLASAILFTLSLPFFYCAWVTLPVGIWAVVVLGHPDVRARFLAEEQSRQQSEAGRPRTDQPE